MLETTSDNNLTETFYLKILDISNHSPSSSGNPCVPPCLGLPCLTTQRWRISSLAKTPCSRPQAWSSPSKHDLTPRSGRLWEQLDAAVTLVTQCVKSDQRTSWPRWGAGWFATGAHRVVPIQLLPPEVEISSCNWWTDWTSAQTRNPNVLFGAWVVIACLRTRRWHHFFQRHLTMHVELLKETQVECNTSCVCTLELLHDVPETMKTGTPCLWKWRHSHWTSE